MNFDHFLAIFEHNISRKKYTDFNGDFDQKPAG